MKSIPRTRRTSSLHDRFSAASCWKRLAAVVVFLFLSVFRVAAADSSILEADLRYSGSKTGLTAVAASAGSPSQTNLLKVLRNDPNSLSFVNALLFEGTEDERLAARRELRMAWLVPLPPPPEVDSPAFNPIDRFIAAKWKESGLSSAVKPPDICDDTTFLRRVSLDLIGRIPTVEECKTFLADVSETKRASLVEALLSRTDAYAAHWTSIWMDWFSREAGSGAKGAPALAGDRDWIFRSLAENRPYDVIVAQWLDPLMPGSPNSKGIAGHDPSANSERNNEETLQAAADAAHVFLGVNVRCAMCHDDPEAPEWSHERFLAFAGFFADQDLKGSAPTNEVLKLIPAAFPFEVPGAPKGAPQGLEARLRRLSQLMVDPANLRFARTIVNRLWKQFFGLGLIEPIDDARADRPVFHSDLLLWLADDLIRHGYDLKHAIRQILSSRTYQLRYNPKLADRFDPEHPEAARYFESPSLRRLSAEQFVESVRVATGQTLQPVSREYIETRSTRLLRALAYPAWREPISANRPAAIGTGAPFEVLYGEDLWQMISPSPLVQRHARETKSTRAVDDFYWAVFARAPTAEELREGSEFLEATFSGEFKTASSETVVWVDEELPQGSSVSGSSGVESWRWTASPEFPVLSGRRSHTQVGAGIQRQHYFSGANPSLVVNADDILFAHVFLQRDALPREIMMQWNDGSWEHRAYWGENLIRLGQDASPGRRHVGALPKSGEWVMLTVPARDVGIQGDNPIIGWSFDQLDGVVFWDKAGVIRVRNVPPEEPLQDLLWALLSSPEFQFIR